MKVPECEDNEVREEFDASLELISGGTFRFTKCKALYKFLCNKTN
jgi:hypothetical protein